MLKIHSYQIKEHILANKINLSAIKILSKSNEWIPKTSITNWIKINNIQLIIPLLNKTFQDHLTIHKWAFNKIPKYLVNIYFLQFIITFILTVIGCKSLDKRIIIPRKGISRAKYMIKASDCAFITFKNSKHSRPQEISDNAIVKGWTFDLMNMDLK